MGETQEDPDTELPNGMGKPADGDSAGDDSISPRGVLETPVSGSLESDNGSISSSSSCGSSTMEKLSIHRTPIGDSQGLQWKNLVESIKWKSVRRFSTIPLLGGYEISKKNLRKKLGRIRSADNRIDCGDVVAPKPSWKNFTHAELAAATDNFSPGKKGKKTELSLSLCFLLLFQSPLFLCHPCFFYRALVN
ncbi:non-specific serine,threonine protein kinase [Sarracenia purpurea var. burkii]